MFRNVITKTFPIQQTIVRRGYTSTPFLKDFITSEQKGPVETSMESKVNYYFYFYPINIT